MLDPILRLALAVYNNKGAYALLVGSGVSRAARIPTGWEIVSDLVRQVATLQGADAGEDSQEWYRQTYGEEARYSPLLERLAKPPTERAQLLRRYFEPSEEERTQGLKSPTAAHAAIADLVAKGYIKLIITTNFDRLIERALDNRGIVPTVVATTDAIQGAPPIAQSQCTILKVNGDYLDTRIRNTEGELQSYDDPMNRLLDRLLDEYGLIVLGWSAEWDIALRAAIERAPSRRYGTYWALRREPTELERSLIGFRGAEVVHIKDADAFLTSLAEKVTALEVVQAPHPISAAAAVATMKTYLSEPRHRIRLHDFMREEVERLVERISPEHFPDRATASGEELAERLSQYESASGSVVRLMATGCYWGEDEHRDIWIQSLRRLANAHYPQSVGNIWQTLRRYPALLVFYAGGIASVMSAKYATLASLLREPIIRDFDKDAPATLLLNTWKVFPEFQQRLPGMERHYTPLSERLETVMFDPLKEWATDAERFQRAFDRFEYMLALTYQDLKGRAWVPWGCFAWRHRSETDRRISAELLREAAQKGKVWAPLAAGLFGGSLERFQEISKEVQTSIAGLGWY